MRAYGKVTSDQDVKAAVPQLQVPKSWFVHFYITGVTVNGYLVYTLVRFYVFHVPIPSWIHSLLGFMDLDHQISTDGLSTLILSILMFMQTIRRLHECLFVSVYSKGTMHFVHYMLGILLYSTFTMGVLVEAPRTADYLNLKESIWSNLSWRHLVGVVTFLWASKNHHRVHEQFAEFRQNKKGEVVTLKHIMPHGEWFELISTPHYFMEIMIYLSYLLIGGYHHFTLVSVVLFVVINQLVVGLVTHSWYKSEYKDYPTSRKAIIPYIL